MGWSPSIDSWADGQASPVNPSRQPSKLRTHEAQGMDEWQQLWNGLVQGVTQEVGHLVENVFETVDTLADLVEETVVEAQKIVTSELERTFPFLGDDEFWAEFWDFEDTEDGHSTYTNIYGVEPMNNPPTACHNCMHFHGQSYNGTPLVCGMHPYGPTEESCPDWSNS